MHKNNRSTPPAGSAVRALSVAAFCLAMAPAIAQDGEAPATGTPATGTVAAEPNPYYVGVGQGFTHDSNVYRIPSGPGDTYSSTTLFGGFDQPISRQRVFGRGGVSLNRYFNEQPLNHTSYDFLLGAALATIENISGNVNLGLTQNLAAPISGVNLPDSGIQRRNHTARRCQAPLGRTLPAHPRRRPRLHRCRLFRTPIRDVRVE